MRALWCLTLLPLAILQALAGPSEVSSQAAPPRGVVATAPPSMPEREAHAAPFAGSLPATSASLPFGPPRALPGPQVASTDEAQQLRCTPQHPFWVVGRGWVAAEDLRPGDELVGANGETLVVTAQSITAEEADHYNFEVEDWHTYFVSETEQDPAVWVHNDCRVKVDGTRGLEHSYDRHADEWFGRHGGTKSIEGWRELIRSALRSEKRVPWSTGDSATTGYLARIDGNKYFFVQVFKNGPRAGELATAFIPNSKQLGAILRLLRGS